MPAVHTLANKLQPADLVHHLWVIPVIALLYWLSKVAWGTDIPKIAGIPELPHAVPFYGHLKLLGLDHASVFHQSYQTKGWEVVQAKLGNRRALVLNSYDAAATFMVKNASATISRPLFHTFHTVVSTTQGPTIGTAPWNESTKKMRTVAGSLTTRPAIQKSAPTLDLETSSLVGDLFKATAQGTQEVDPRIFFQRQSLNLTLLWCYGTRISDVEDPLLHKILHVAHSVSTFRSTNNNIQDYVPFYRYLGQSKRTRIALNNRIIRDSWLGELYQKVVNAVAAGKEVDCISRGLMDGTSSKLSEAEIKSINVSFVSGGFETLATSGIALIGYLSTEEGQAIQEKAYQDIMAHYGSVEVAWRDCLLDEKSPYVVALVREGLRYYCPIPLIPPRQTVKAFEWHGHTIPAGVTVYVNGQSVNHDPACYGPDAHLFRPERWLDDNEKLMPGPPYHFSYGAGSRMCTAVTISNRILYATYVRLIINFRLLASPTAPPTTDFVDFNENRTDATAIPKRYRIQLKPRQDAAAVEALVQSTRPMELGVAL